MPSKELLQTISAGRWLWLRMSREELFSCLEGEHRFPLFTSWPQRLCELAEVSVAAHAAGKLLILDVSELSAGLCTALSHGADLLVEEIADGTFVLVFGKDARKKRRSKQKLDAQTLQTIEERKKALLKKLGPYLIEDGAEGFEKAWEEKRAELAAAAKQCQLAASFLSCHPKVKKLHYVGDRTHEQYGLASSILLGGFGPFLDVELHEGSSSAFKQELSRLNRRFGSVEFVGDGALRFRLTKDADFEFLTFLDNALRLYDLHQT